MSSFAKAAGSVAKNYIGFLVGLIFGASVASLTCVSILGTPSVNQENISDVDKLKECLFKINE
tara:strand:- start:3676 stop:3864 length:189 start_codon:yes stop_codon:yes gene_type:complete